MRASYPLFSPPSSFRPNCIPIDGRFLDVVSWPSPRRLRLASAPSAYIEPRSHAGAPPPYCTRTPLLRELPAEPHAERRTRACYASLPPVRRRSRRPAPSPSAPPQLQKGHALCLRSIVTPAIYPGPRRQNDIAVPFAPCARVTLFRNPSAQRTTHPSPVRYMPRMH